MHRTLNTSILCCALILIWLSSTHLTAVGRLSLPRESQNYLSQSSEKRRDVSAPNGWRKLDAGPFSLFAPAGWEFHQLVGVDSYVGEFVGEVIALTFDFGQYSSGYLEKTKKPAYVIDHESFGGFSAKIVSPKTPGHGLTGIYFRNVGHSNGLCVFGRDLTSSQQELVLKIFETLRFGGPFPRYVLPPPPPAKNVQ